VSTKKRDRTEEGEREKSQLEGERVYILERRKKTEV
jgi:hypothetical protein